VIEELNEIQPLFPSFGNCSFHRFSNQPSDVCLHDPSSNHLLSINVKWFANNRADTNTVDASS